MTREEAKEQLEFMLEQMPEEPPTECDYIDEWLDTNRKIRNVLEMAIKALQQEPCKDIMTIHTQGLDEGIRCAMCTNSMKSDRGCDGGCVVNEAMYKEVMNTIRNHIVPPVTPARKKGNVND